MNYETFAQQVQLLREVSEDPTLIPDELRQWKNDGKPSGDLLSQSALSSAHVRAALTNNHFLLNAKPQDSDEVLLRAGYSLSFERPSETVWGLELDKDLYRAGRIFEAAKAGGERKSSVQLRTYENKRDDSFIKTSCAIGPTSFDVPLAFEKREKTATGFKGPFDVLRSNNPISLMNRVFVGFMPSPAFAFRIAFHASYDTSLPAHRADFIARVLEGIVSGGHVGFRSSTLVPAYGSQLNGAQNLVLGQHVDFLESR